MGLNKEEVGARFTELIDDLGISMGKFAEEVGVSQPAVSKWTHGKSTPSPDTFGRIREVFKVNSAWLKHGKGQMYESGYTQGGGNNMVKENEAEYYTNTNKMSVPLVSQYAHAGYLSGYGDPEYVEELPKVEWPVELEPRGTYMAFEVKGDSMFDGSYDSYKEGNLLLGRQVARHHWANRLHLHKWKDYIVVHRAEGILIKRIIEHNVDEGTITLHSLNEMWEDFTVKLDEVDQIFNVVKVLK